jgi:hypothetical protein
MFTTSSDLGSHYRKNHMPSWDKNVRDLLISSILASLEETTQIFPSAREYFTRESNGLSRSLRHI